MNAKNILIDSHCHLDFPDYTNDLDEVVTRARLAGISYMLTISTRVSQFTRVLALAERYVDVYCTVGTHPHEAEHEALISEEQLVDLAHHPRVVGFGETGLDYFYEHSMRADQQRSFRTHIAAARRTGLPVVIHSRAADDDMAYILKEEMAKGPFTGLLHCFSSSTDLASLAIRFNLLISISGIVTFRKTRTLESIVRNLPLSSLLVETDAPFLTPEPRRGQRNEPALITYIAARVAALRGITLVELAHATTRNFLNLFTKVDSTRLKSMSEHWITRCG